MGYRSELESRLAKKTTKAIVDYDMLENGDRVMVGLSGGKDSWALLQVLDVLRARAPIRFSLGALKAMPAKLVSDDGAHVVIRPLVYVGEAEARAYTKECELPIIGCCCPACGDLGLQRQRTKRMLMELEREHPGVKQSMLKAIGNVAPRHLLDTRLNPPGELRATVRLTAFAEATAVKKADTSESHSIDSVASGLSR